MVELRTAKLSNVLFSMIGFYLYFSHLSSTFSSSDGHFFSQASHGGTPRPSFLRAFRAAEMLRAEKREQRAESTVSES